MTTDETILLTGLHGDDYPARVAFETDDFDGKELPVTAELQVQDDDGEWHTLRTLNHEQMMAYWADLEKLRQDARAEGLIDHWRTACAIF